MRVVLISTYDLGHQPFGLASPAAWLRTAGARVACLDLAVEPDHSWHAVVQTADLVAFYLPMHTATRLAIGLIKQVRERNPGVHLCCYGLYAPLNEALLRDLGVETILGGEYEASLVALYRRLLEGSGRGPQVEPRISLAKQTFLPPQRQGLPELTRYAYLQLDTDRRVVGYTEASRGCKHHCRHCPIVPVYDGRFRVVPLDVVLADIRQQVLAGAEHITFGDPDFLNGPAHALRLVAALHAEFPALTYDVTIKIEHLLQHALHLPVLRDTGCLLVTSAVEAVDETILQHFDKRHTAADFVRAVGLLREVGLTFNPTFVAFTPWTSAHGYVKLLQTIDQLDLVEHVAPVQYAIRLLLPAGSKLMELPEVQMLAGAFDPAALCYPWVHPDPEVDRLQAQVLQLVSSRRARTMSRRDLFEQIWSLAHGLQPEVDKAALPQARERAPVARRPVPRLSEPWYC